MLPSPEIFGITFSWYGMFHKLALLVAAGFFFLHFREIRALQLKPLTMLALFLLIVLTGYAGARTFSFLDYVTTGGNWKVVPLEWVFTGQGLRWYGSILFFLLLLPALARWFGRHAVEQVFDKVALTLCLFTAVVKLACLFSGDGCYGVPTTLPWPFGMYFPYGQEPNILPAHPTPLYDSVFHLGLFVFLFRFAKTAPLSGHTAMLFFCCTAGFNIALECIRRNPEIAFGLTLAQWTYCLVFVVALLRYRHLKSRFTRPDFRADNRKKTVPHNALQSSKS